jgi:hypothetical protein
MRYYGRLGLDAPVNAALAGNLMLDLEVLESLGCDVVAKFRTYRRAL